jgi:short subunit dehydrogenase-like uncharacterized protein
VLYGAYGYTGVLIAEEAVRRGHRPILAGRDPRKLEALATRLGLEFQAVDLADAAALDQLLARVDLVFHAAGPFASTSTPMVEACLRTRTHYVDITGEVRVFEDNLARDAEARAAGIAIMSGVGFDVVPTDCAARHVAERLPDATSLDIAFAIDGPVSGGTAATAIDGVPDGILVRRAGQLVRQRAGSRSRRVALGDRDRTIVPMTWGDLATAYRTTGIENITVHMVTSRVMPWVMQLVVPPTRLLLRLGAVRRFVRWLAKRKRTDQSTDRANTLVWARASNARGQTAEVVIRAMGSYPFTAVSGLLAVERLLTGAFTGALTPAGAFGADFVREIPGTTISASSSC